MVTETQTARIEGERIRWRATGSGPPIVLVHGLAGSWRWWRPLLPALAAEHRVHLLDLPGFGGLPLPRRFDLDGAVDWLAGWARAAALGPADVIGHSLGGLLGARLAARHPEVVRRLVLIAPAGVPGRTPVSSALPLSLALLRSQPRLLALLARDAIRSGPVTIGTAALAVLAADLRDDLPRISAPTLIVMGGRDALIPVSHGKELSDALPNARLVVLEHSGHVPMDDEPEELSRLLLGFLRESS